jgi:hypothetical protein
MLSKCRLSSFWIVDSMPNLVVLIINSCEILENLTLSESEHTKLDEFLEIIEIKDLKTLELSNFFDNSVQSERAFNKFCDILPEIKTLRVLNLNHNSLTFQNLLKLNSVINKTQIE